jgi:hypothetical protein
MSSYIGKIEASVLALSTVEMKKKIMILHVFFFFRSILDKDDIRDKEIVIISVAGTYIVLFNKKYGRFLIASSLDNKSTL